MKSANSNNFSESDLVKEWYNIAIENALDMVFIHDNEGKITYVNETGVKESGYSQEELLQMNPAQLVPPEYYGIMTELQVKRLNGDMSVFFYEMEYIKKNGERIPVKVSSSPIIKDNGLEGFIHIVRNTSEVKKTEALLSAELELASKLCRIHNINEALREILNTAFLFTNVDCGGVYILEKDTNDYSLKIHHNLSREFIDKISRLSSEEKGLDQVRSGMPIYLSESEYDGEINPDMMHILKDKEKIKSFFIAPLSYKNEFIGAFVFASHESQDITETTKIFLSILAKKAAATISRIKAEEKADSSDIKYREIVESANSIIFVFDNKGKILSMNEYGLSFFGYKKNEIVGKNVYDTITPKIESSGRDLRNLVNDIHTKIKEFGVHINENIKKNGEKVWIYWGNKPIYDDKGELSAILAVGNDITEKRNLEEKIKHSEIKFKALFENANEPILILNNDFLIEDVNKATIKALGYKKEKLLDNMNIFDFSSPLET
ncbi:MAG TPA: PAS domain S-box protein, partial [Methanofastidiosum sp.]|nr:PAS domain S-box protein [Methanofastidiosum sp.]